MAERIVLKPINIEQLTVTIEGRTPLIQHQWSEKAKKQIRDKNGGKKTKDRSPCKPKQEFEAATYRTADGGYGVPVTAIKAALVSAAHKDIGIEKVLVKKSLFILCDDPGGILPMDCSKPTMREDWVRFGMNTTSLAYRPEFATWAVTFTVEYNADNLTPTDIVNLIDLAGFGVGINEWRPEKGGEFGRFRVRAEAA
jgi:hypothetical protein